jgi:DNA invertase Pin-like site-specific DNA recombinase
VNEFYAYIRVSTVRQGEHGVSLQEQKEAIERYAARKNLAIVAWFEEQQTAAKQGRPVFNRMLKLLRANKAAGAIIHKIDRSARNLRDWAALGELIDLGIAVHFTNDSVDLSSTTGRLSADIQAVVAAHYIRNLREEALKGFYGRLKQGISPLPAVLGYLDTGAGKPKALDPVRAPLMKTAFDLYSSGQYSLEALEVKLFELGLRSKSGKKVSDSVLSRLLSNPFYMGVIRIKRTGETYLGLHQSLVSKELFDRVKRILTGRYTSGSHRHEFLFRRFIRCKHCGYNLIPELQKGHVYYRCQVNNCPTKTIREEIIDAAVREKLGPLQLQETEIRYLHNKCDYLAANWEKQHRGVVMALDLQISQAKERLSKLTDAYLEGIIDKTTFAERKTTLIVERRDLEDKLGIAQKTDSSIPKKVQSFLELTQIALSTYDHGTFERKRRLLEKVTSNRDADSKNVEITLAFPFSDVAGRLKFEDGRAPRSRARILDELIGKVWRFLETDRSDWISELASSS